MVSSLIGSGFGDHLSDEPGCRGQCGFQPAEPLMQSAHPVVQAQLDGVPVAADQFLAEGPFTIR